MRTHLTHKTIPWAFAAALLLATGCGDDNDTSSDGGDSEETEAPAETAAGDSDYCDAAAEWSAYDAFTTGDENDPADLEVYWSEFKAFEQEALATAPDELQADWELKTELESETIDVVFEKYGYDMTAIMEEATAEEQAALEAPPEAQAAQDRIHAYETEVCGAQFPEAADVSFAGEEPGSYCELVAADDERGGEALASGDPAAIEEYVTSQADSNAAILDAAPDVIKDNVAAVKAWAEGPQAEVIEAHSWDLEAAMVDGSGQERLDLNYADDDIREQYARVIAYEEQVCGA